MEDQSNPFLTFLNLLYGLPPFVAYLVVLRFSKDLKKALYFGMTAGCLEFLLRWALTGDLDKLSLVVTGLIVLFGIAGVKGKDPFWFKLQPVVVLVGAMAAGVYAQFFAGGLVHMFQEKIASLAPEPMNRFFEDPEFLATYEMAVTLMIVVALPAQALLLWYASKRWSDEVWLGIRAFGLYPMVFVVGVAGVLVRALFSIG